MKKASEYRQHAEQCRQLARQAPSEEERRLLHEMASNWDAVAEERERKAAAAVEADRRRGALEQRRKNGRRA